MEKENDDYLKTLQLEVTQCEITKKFSSSSENKPLEDSDTINSSTEETLVQNEYLLVDTEFPLEQCEEISQPQNCERNGVRPASCTMNDKKARSQLVEDLFKVNDDLDEEWWNSL